MEDFDEQGETVDYLTNARNHVRRGFADSLRAARSEALRLSATAPRQAFGT